MRALAKNSYLPTYHLMNLKISTIFFLLRNITLRYSQRSKDNSISIVCMIKPPWLDNFHNPATPMQTWMDYENYHMAGKLTILYSLLLSIQVLVLLYNALKGIKIRQSKSYCATTAQHTTLVRI